MMIGLALGQASVACNASPNIDVLDACKLIAVISLIKLLLDIRNYKRARALKVRSKLTSLKGNL